MWIVCIYGFTIAARSSPRERALLPMTDESAAKLPSRSWAAARCECEVRGGVAGERWERAKALLRRSSCAAEHVLQLQRALLALAQAGL